MERGLESNTAYAIVSIDIADIAVGANIGASLMALQADADSRVARAVPKCVEPKPSLRRNK